LEKLFQDVIKEDVFIKNMEKYGKRKFCCKTRTLCVGIKCRKVSRKCKFVGKIIKKYRKSSCVVQDYANKSSRRKLCCTWTNLCYGLNKFKCRPVNKRCSWKGPIHQIVPKVSCKWERKTRRSKQRHCCHWLRSCVTKKLNEHRNCHDGPKKMQMGWKNT